MTALLEGKVALVTGAGSDFGRELVLGLEDAGARVAAPTGLDWTTRGAIDQAFLAVADETGPLDLVVHAEGLGADLEPRPFHEIDDACWDTTCEKLIRAAIFSCQAAQARMRETGGRIVLVIPTFALSGAPQLVAQASAYEAIRILAKSAARQWGSLGITVNTVAVGIALGGSHSLGEPALGRAPDVRADVAPVIAMLASEAAHFLTGETLKVDGGVWLTG